MNLVELAAQEIRTEINNQVEGLSFGTASDFATYQRHCGVIQGLREALVIFEDLIKLSEQDDDN